MIDVKTLEEEEEEENPFPEMPPNVVEAAYRFMKTMGEFLDKKEKDEENEEDRDELAEAARVFLMAIH